MDVTCGLGACTGDCVIIAKGAAQDAFGKVGAAGVASAENEYGGFHMGEMMSAQREGSFDGWQAPATAAAAVTHTDTERHGKECAKHWCRKVEPHMFDMS